METEHRFNLINGEFTPAEARNILFVLVNSKIKFHQTESFGIAVRSSGDTSFHDNRIKQLTQTNDDIRKVLDYTTANKIKLKINGTIEIKFVNEQG